MEREHCPQPPGAGSAHGHSKRVWGVAFAPDNRTLATAGADRAVHVWDLDATPVQSSLGPLLPRCRTEVSADHPLSFRTTFVVRKRCAGSVSARLTTTPVQRARPNVGR
ncbi:hypothetical protein [Lentzea sp.]|uniref:hypothetical protein n=1 Tax=Lentzea sp. TaxID=56099 RepID=UPI0039C988BC